MFHPPSDYNVRDAERTANLGVIGGAECRQHLFEWEELVEGFLESTLHVVVDLSVPFTLRSLSCHDGHLRPSVPTTRQAVGAAGPGRSPASDSSGRTPSIWFFEL